MKESLKKYLKKRVVLDTRSSFLYIGKLEKVLENCVVLTDVDVHDSRETATSKEVYVLESKKTGIKANRDRVFINLDYVISFSGLDEVKFF
jgi:small nuclear ribonucleoprotein (snRNP)-like protein